MATPMSRTGQMVDLTNCDREPIHIPGVIQPHGCLLAFDSVSLAIEYASDNCREILSRPASAILGKTVSSLFADFASPAGDSDAEIESLNPVMLRVLDSDSVVETHLHRNGRHVIAECFAAEPVSSKMRNYFHYSRSTVAALRATKSFDELLQSAVKAVREITGFDRVTLYTFDETWNGHVLAESKGEPGDSYLDLHFPASDIPKQARELYYVNPLRFIPNVAYQGSKLVAQSEALGPLDLSKSVLRGVSPIHIEYLRNMEATASMSVSLKRDGKLWGLISATHLSGPLHLPYETRAVCELIGEVVSSLIPARDTENTEQLALRVATSQSRLTEALSIEDDFGIALIKREAALLDLVGAGGAAVVTEKMLRTVGHTPTKDEILRIIDFMTAHTSDTVFHTDSLPLLMPEASSFKSVAAGVLGFPISRARSSYVLWFKPEVIQSVKWGGNPNKPVIESSGNLILHPRKSFEAWQETVRDQSTPWKSIEVAAASQLRSAIVEIVLQRLERIESLNRELERSNNELDSFAYAASHDLKEPLRGIQNYATLLKRSLAGVLKEDQDTKFATISRLTTRMEDLINSLLNYSRLGRVDLEVHETDLNEIVRASLDSLKTRIDESAAEIVCNFNFPHESCDRVQVTELFTNLISNAIKYNDSEKKRVEIGWTDSKGEPATYFVKDNGIGIPPEFQSAVFKIFKRLHARDKYGGGAGTGLTIVSKIIERHGGKIWLTSEAGRGTTFYFTLRSKTSNEG